VQLPYTAFIALSVVLILLGSGRHFDYIEYVLNNDTINRTEVLDFAAHILYTTALLTCRLSGLAFYARICDRHGTLTWAVRGAAAFMVAGYIPQLFLIIFHCQPTTGLWPYAFQAEAASYKCLPWGVVYVANSTISMCCDLILFTIPASIIHALNISLGDKLKLVCVLMPGLLVIAISAVRMYLVIDSQWVPDESWTYDPFLAVEVAEIGSTMIALSIPALKPFLGSVFSFLDRTFVGGTHTPGFRAPQHLTWGTSARRVVDPNADISTRDLNKWTGGSVQRAIGITIHAPPVTNRPTQKAADLDHAEASTIPPAWLENTAQAYHPRSLTSSSTLNAGPPPSGINWRRDMTVMYEDVEKTPG
jgi:hypothetical protein